MPDISVLGLSPEKSELLKFSHRDIQKWGGATAQLGLPISQYEIMGLEIPERTHGRVDFTGYIETVSDVPGCIWDPLTRNSDLRSDGQTS